MANQETGRNMFILKEPISGCPYWIDTVSGLLVAWAGDRKGQLVPVVIDDDVPPGLHHRGKILELVVSPEIR
jgi:hypothetical protein